MPTPTRSPIRRPPPPRRGPIRPPLIPGRRALTALGGTLALILASLTVPDPALAHAGHAAPASAALSCAPKSPHTGLNAGLPTPEGYAPSRGTVTALTLFIDFPGSEATIPTTERFAEFFPGTSEYLATSSYGKLRYRAEPVHRWLRMSRPFEDYGIDRGVGWHPDDPDGYNRLMREIVSALGDETDFAAYDLVNVLATPNAGPHALEQVLSVSFAGRPLVDTPSGPLRNISFIWSTQPGESPHRVLVHENGHAFGLPDLYWTGAGVPPLLTGHWDVMEQDWGPSNDLLAWHKWKLGWLAPGQVACVTAPGGSEHLLTPLGDPAGDGVRMVALPTGPHQVIVAEVRAPSELDRAVCRTGVLISRVDTRARSGEGPIRVADATPGSSGCLAAPDPQVTAELTDAPYLPGDTFRDHRAGITVQVLEADRDGRHRIRVTRD
ncbi:M6 family metalloprotease domain-containing protein [Streptomyces aidingensis]|uniref:M6 family metalloprotease domain-containing protein n=1 Tax=Streptomyces aidingensis TaxID=910347 RepID=A0A1I1H987_9ACTN|nr:M6 family metalloprotease domain-containing protein [Streptomyces aidingensis]SFC18043.1 M6 family metalloprotease domain-containing protein [Streptomyces aidingensis]